MRRTSAPTLSCPSARCAPVGPDTRSSTSIAVCRTGLLPPLRELQQSSGNGAHDIGRGDYPDHATVGGNEQPMNVRVEHLSGGLTDIRLRRDGQRSWLHEIANRG